MVPIIAKKSTKSSPNVCITSSSIKLKQWQPKLEASRCPTGASSTDFILAAFTYLPTTDKIPEFHSPKSNHKLIGCFASQWAPVYVSTNLADTSHLQGATPQTPVSIQVSYKTVQPMVLLRSAKNCPQRPTLFLLYGFNMRAFLRGSFKLWFQELQSLALHKLPLEWQQPCEEGGSCTDQLVAQRPPGSFVDNISTDGDTCDFCCLVTVNCCTITKRLRATETCPHSIQKMSFI